MNELMLYSLLLIASTFLSSISQIMLKISAKKEYSSPLREYLNPLVIAAYGLFFSCTFLTMYSLKVVPLSLAPILEATSYVFVTFLGWACLKERVSRKKLLGLGVILVGIIIYSL